MVIKQKRGQIASNVAVWIFGLIVVVLILLLGWKLIGGNKDDAQRALIQQFKDDIRNDISRLSNEFNSAELKTYKAPQGIDSLCFIDVDAYYDEGFPPVPDNPIVQDALDDRIPENALLFRDGQVEKFDVGDITLPYPNYVCIPADGNQEFKFHLKGKGSYTQLVQIPPESECQDYEDTLLCNGTIVLNHGDSAILELCQSMYNLCLNP